MLDFLFALLPLEGGGNSSDNGTTSLSTENQNSPMQFTIELPLLGTLSPPFPTLGSPGAEQLNASG